jgi:hypothetical protein
MKPKKQDDDEDDEDDEIDISSLSIDDPDAPLKAQSAMSRANKKQKSSRPGPIKTHMPDFKTMVTHGRPQDSLRKPFGDDYLRPAFEGTEWDEPDSYRSRPHTVKPTITPELKGTFKSLSAILAPEGGVLLNEALENEGEEIGIDEYDAGDIDES